MGVPRNYIRLSHGKVKDLEKRIHGNAKSISKISLESSLGAAQIMAGITSLSWYVGGFNGGLKAMNTSDSP